MFVIIWIIHILTVLRNQNSYCLILENVIYIFSRNFCNYQSTLRNIPKQWWSHLHRCWSLRKASVMYIICIQYSWFQAFAVFFMLYAFFWVITGRLDFICRRFGTLCLFHLHRQVCLGRWNRQSVPKRRYINSRRPVITQKKAFNIHNMAKAWNQ